MLMAKAKSLSMTAARNTTEKKLRICGTWLFEELLKSMFPYKMGVTEGETLLA